MNPFKKAQPSPFSSDNALARQTMEAIAKIDREAQQKKRAQGEALLKARDSILGRIDELNHQLAQIDKAMTAITGKAAPAQSKHARRDFNDVRERIGRWLEARHGEKFGAGDLVREFPELEGAAVSYVLKPLVEGGQVRTDTADGSRRPKYYAAEVAAPVQV
jgi:hypothetical protein